MRIKKENAILPLTCGLFMVLSYVIMRMIYRGRYDFLHIISEKIAFLPMWIFNFLYMLTLFLFGFGIGLFIGLIFRGGQSIQLENIFLKGALCVIAVYFLCLLWYPSLFVLQMPFLSLIISILSVSLITIAIIFWLRACASYGIFLIPLAVWLVYLNILNFILIFTI